MDDEVRRRIQGMNGAFFKLKRIFVNVKLDIRTRLTLFNVIIVPHGVYGSQAWNLTKANMADLESTYFRILRKILGCRDRLTPLVQVLAQARGINPEICPLEVRIRQAQIRFFGHVARKDLKDATKEMAYGFREVTIKIMYYQLSR